MTQTPSYLITLSQWGVNVAFWPSVLLLLGAWAVWPWWKTFWGVNIMSLDVAIALALLEPVLMYDFDMRTTNIMLLWVEITALWLVGIIIVWRGFLIISSQFMGAYGFGIRGAIKHFRVRKSLLQRAAWRKQVMDMDHARASVEQKEREESRGRQSPG